MVYRKFLEKVLKSSAKIARKNFGDFSGVLNPKDATQALTKTDLAISKFLVTEIKRQFPNYNIIDEESGVVNNNSEYTWVLDPIDGTLNFSRGVPLFGTMIGLLKGSRPVAGGVTLPAFNEIYTAEKGKGVYCNGEKIKTTKLQSGFSIMAYTIGGHPFSKQVINRKCKILSQLLPNFSLNCGSASVFDCMMVVRGAYAADMFEAGKIWDHVTPYIFVTEAGGLYTDFYGHPMDFSHPLTRTKQNFTACMANPAAHKLIQKIIHKSGL